MITYVNTVLVSNKNNAALATAEQLQGVANKSDLANLVGKFVVMNCDPALQDGTPIQDIYTIDANTDVFKIGVIQDSFFTKSNNGQIVFVPTVKWSNEIRVADIKSLTALTYKADTEDVIKIDFTNLDAETAGLVGRGGIPVVLRLTFKDMPTRYRNWTESYDYYTKPGDDGAAIAAGLADIINREDRRARVYASATGSVLTLEAMPYDDDDSNETENFTSKVRFNATAWFSDPLAPGFASNNKYPIGEISKVPGVQYPASAKNVRDHERTAQGYLGILNRGEWYDRKPAIVADINNQYGGFTLEFENMYRAADDIFRKTKQTVEVYASNEGSAVAPNSIAGGLLGTIKSMIDARQKVVYGIDNSAAYDPESYAKD